jgi:hypothetical protein
MAAQTMTQEGPWYFPHQASCLCPVKPRRKRAVQRRHWCVADIDSTTVGQVIEQAAVTAPIWCLCVRGWAKLVLRQWTALVASGRPPRALRGHNAVRVHMCKVIIVRVGAEICVKPTVCWRVLLREESLVLKQRSLPVRYSSHL